MKMNRAQRAEASPQSAPSLPHDSAKWFAAMADCLSALEREQAGSPCPVVDHELRIDLAGSTPRLDVWLICRNEAEKQTFIDSELPLNASSLRKKMVVAGFPDEAIAALRVKVLSRSEIAKSGGRFNASSG